MTVYVLFYDNVMKGIYSTMKLANEALRRYAHNNPASAGHLVVKRAKVDPRRDPRGKGGNR